MAEQCAWIGGLRNSGVFIDLEQSTFVYPYQAAWGGRERLPVFVGSRQKTDLSMENFENWYNQHPFGKDVEQSDIYPIGHTWGAHSTESVQHPAYNMKST